MPSFTKTRIPPPNSPQSSRNWRTYTGNEIYTGIQRHYTEIGRRVRELGDIYGNWETYTEIVEHIRELGNIQELGDIYRDWKTSEIGRHNTGIQNCTEGKELSSSISKKDISFDFSLSRFFQTCFLRNLC